MIMFHGSSIKNLDVLREGTWVTESRLTAESFGPFVYTLDVVEDDVIWEWLSPDMCDWDTGGKGEFRGQLRKETVTVLSNP